MALLYGMVFREEGVLSGLGLDRKCLALSCFVVETAKATRLQYKLFGLQGYTVSCWSLLYARGRIDIDGLVMGEMKEEEMEWIWLSQGFAANRLSKRSNRRRSTKNNGVTGACL